MTEFQPGDGPDTGPSSAYSEPVHENTFPVSVLIYNAVADPGLGNDAVVEYLARLAEPDDVAKAVTVPADER
jgi:hypothetical protein